MTTASAPPRLLMIGAGFPPHGPIGGYELSWMSFVTHLATQGIDWSVLTTETAGRAERVAHVHRDLKSYKLDSGAFSSPSWRQRLAVERHNNAALKRVIRESRPDVVMFWVMSGMSMSLVETVRRSGLRSAAWVCDFWPEYAAAVDPWHRAGARLPRLLRNLDRLPGVPPLRVEWKQAPTRWVFVSRFLQKYVGDLLSLDADSMRVLYLPVGDVFFDYPHTEHSWQGKALVHGRLTMTKGVDVAIRSLRLASSEVTLSLVGPPDPALDVQAMIDELGVADRVSLRGAVARSDMPAVIASADVVIFPVRWEEPLGLAPLEAMALGVPVIMTATGGAAEYASDGVNCIVVGVDDAEAVARAIDALAADPVLRGRLVQGGYETASTFREAACNEAALQAVVGALA